MKENFLHFVWQHQSFNSPVLKTTEGEAVSAHIPGIANDQSGPDFSDASIQIGQLLWQGNVEIHVRSSNWNDHKHHLDPAYNNVVLHVVWEHDREVARADGTFLPTVEIKELVATDLLKRSRELTENISPLACTQHFFQVDDDIKSGMVARCAAERLQRKGQEVLAFLQQNGNDWDSVAMKLLIRAFGFKHNQTAFSDLSEKISVKFLRRISGRPFQLEAALFGLAGMLSGRSKDDYHQALKDEYLFLRKIYSLTSAPMAEVAWKFGGSRPQNFPTRRIAQLAALLSNLRRPFNVIREAGPSEAFHDILSPTLSPYWETHFTFGKSTPYCDGALGKSSTRSLLINWVSPILAAYSKFSGEPQYLDHAIAVLRPTPAENNAKTRAFAKLGFRPKNSFESQGLIELFDRYCGRKQCLSCNIGTQIVRKTNG